MSARAAVAAWLAFAARVVAQGSEGERAFVEVQVAPTSVYLQQACELVIRIGIDAQWFATAAVPLFQQRLDQPFQVLVPWVAGAADRAVSLLPAPANAASARIAVGDQVVAAAHVGRRDVGGRQFDLLELRYRWLPLAAGTSTIAPVALRYAFATRFDDDFLRGRQPLDRHERSVLSAPLELPVRALPHAGRPAGFTGAVGEFVIAATTTVASVPVGGTFDLELAITGAGNLDRMAPLPAPDLPGFHVQGVRETRRGPGRTFVFAVLALRAGASAVPPIEFAAFSPRLGDYVVHRSEPVPLRVEPLPDGVVLPPAIAALVHADAEAVRAAQAWPWWSYGLAALLLAAGMVVVCRRRRRSRPDHELPAAWTRLTGAATSGAAAQLSAFEDLCAVRAGAAAFDGATVWSELAAVGIEACYVAAARDLHAALDAARFGGVPPPADQVLATARHLLPERMREEGVEPSRPLPARGF